MLWVRSFALLYGLHMQKYCTVVFHSLGTNTIHNYHNSNLYCATLLGVLLCFAPRRLYMSDKYNFYSVTIVQYSECEIHDCMVLTYIYWCHSYFLSKLNMLLCSSPPLCVLLSVRTSNKISLSCSGNLLYKNLNYFWAKYFGKIENGHLLMSIFQFTE